MKNLNLPNKITLSRIFLGIAILIILLIPWSNWISSWPVYYNIFGTDKTFSPNLDLKYIIAGVLFLIASITDRLDGQIARKRNMVTDLGKTLDAIADKILVNGVLIILAYNRFIPLIIPVVIITRDIITDTCKSVSGSKGLVVAASWTGKIKTVFMMTGLTFTFFGNLPFELVGIPFNNFLLYIAVILSVISGCQYFYNTMKLLEEN